MKNTLLAALLLAGSVPPLFAQRAGPEITQQLFDEVAAADQALFSAFFDRCDLPALAKLVTDDFEMFHDKNGYMARQEKNSSTRSAAPARARKPAKTTGRGASWCPAASRSIHSTTMAPWKWACIVFSS